MKAKLTNSNSKLGSAIWNFNIPAGLTCGKYATAECMKFCYAKKGHFQFGSTRDCHMTNFEGSKLDSFVNDISNQITDNLNSIKFVRIHGSGEFYNVEYFSKWVSIALKFPKINFIAYTKNFDIDGSNLPSNMIIRESITGLKERNKSIVGKTFVIMDKSLRDQDNHLKEYTNELGYKGYICNSECKKCSFCYDVENRDKTVFMIKH